MTFPAETVSELESAGILTGDSEQPAAVPEPEAAAEVEAVEPTAEVEAPAAPADEPLGDAGLRALKAERDARAKAEAELKSLSGLKGQLTKATNQAAEAAKSRDELASELAKYKVAVTHGLSREDMDLLPSGVDEDTLERIAVRFSSAPRRPAPDANQGRDSAAPDDPKAAFAALLDQLS